MNMKRIFIGASSLLMSFALSAAEVSSADVELVAKGWVRDNAQAFGQLGAFQSVKAELDENGQTLWYWVVMEKGALVVAPDTEIEPVIAMLPRCDGTLPANHPMRAMLKGDLARRVAEAKALQSQAAQKPGRLLGVSASSSAASALSPTATKWQRLKGRATPSRLLGAEPPHVIGSPATIVKWLDGWNGDDAPIRYWTQDSPFNNYTPMADTLDLMGKPTKAHAVVGCVATAGASVLHYFRVPQGESNVVDYCYVDGVWTNCYTKGGAYDWSLFDDPSADQEAWNDLVARVSYDVGLLTHMRYTCEESGANGFNLMKTLRDHFGLTAARYVSDTAIDSAYYPKLVYNQIRAGSPVIFGIDCSTSSDPVGHEVVACGYGIDADNADYTYIFCGWAGLGDAWYSLPHIDTKATVGGPMAAYDTIDGMIVGLSTNACYVPLVGRVVDTEGLPVTNALTLADGTLVHPDANGYWGVRIDPGLQNKVIYDPVGDPHVFTVGVDASTPKNKTEWIESPQKLAAALPEAMEIVVKRELIDKGFAIVSDYEVAARQALAEGKLLYVFGGADEEAVQALKDDFRANSNETFFTSYVFWQVDASRYRTLANSPFFAGAADPRTINPDALWSEANGQWTAGLEAWSLTNRAAKAGGLTLAGPTSVNSAAAGSHKYVLTVSYEDGVVANLNAKLIDWTVDDPAKASVRLGYLTPVRGATGAVKVTAAASTLFGEEGLSASLDVTLTDGPCQIIGGCLTNTCVIAVDDDTNVLERAREIAQGDNSGKNPGMVSPAFNKTGYDPFVEEIPFGSTLKLKMQASRTFVKQYVLRCAGLEVKADDEVVANVVFDADESATVAYDYVVCGAVTRVGWKWKTDKYYVALGSQGDAKLYCGTGYYPAGSNLVVNVLSGTGVKTNDEWVTVWSGCDRSELGVSCATVAVDRVRSVYAYAVNLSDENVTKTVNVPSTNALVVAKGYKIELVAENVSAWGEATTYDIKVVRRATPEPEWVEPGPIAFTSIEKVDGEWVLVATNATQWSEYSLWGGTTLKTNEWVSPVVDWVQRTEPDGPITNCVPVVDDAAWFWVMKARPGLKPAE